MSRNIHTTLTAVLVVKTQPAATGKTSRLRHGQEAHLASGAAAHGARLWQSPAAAVSPAWNAAAGPLDTAANRHHDAKMRHGQAERARTPGQPVRGEADSMMPIIHSPGAFIFLLSALLFLSPASRSVGRAEVSWWLNMESGTNGAALTASILNAATLGGSTAVGAGWSLFPGPTASTMVSMKVYAGNEQPLSGPVTINGTAYTDSGSTRSFSSRNDRRNHYVKYTFPARQPKVSMGCYLRLENLTGTWGYYDLIHLGGGGYYVVLALRDAPWDPDHPYDPNNPDDLERRRAIRVHSQAPPYVGSDIPIFANKTYWITMLWDTNPWDANPGANKRGTAMIKVYDPQTWLPVGGPSVLELSDYPITAPLNCEEIQFGRCDNHGDTSPASYHYFDDLLVDESGTKWPLLPGEISFAALPQETTGVPIPATLKASATDPEGDPLTVKFYGRTAGPPPGPAFTSLQTNSAVPSGSVTTAMWNGLSFDTEYEWYATASDGVETAISAVWKFRTTNNTPPSVVITAPQNNALFPTPTADIWIEASASDSNGVVTRVEFFAGATLLGEDTGSPFSYLWNAVPEGFYTLTAVAHDDQGAQTTSAPITFTVGGPPSAPDGLTATAQSQGAILLTWTDRSGNETGFEIDQSLDGLNFSFSGTVGPNVTIALMSGLQPGTTYFYRIRAFNGAGPSDNSNVANATTPLPPPAAPTALAATAVSASQINLSWTDNAADETAFEIYQSQDGVNFISNGTVGSDVTNTQITSLQPATTYSFQVRAFNVGGQSGNSSTASATTLPLPPVAPTGLAATAASSSQIDLVWADAASNEAGFRIERSTDGASFSEVATVLANVTAWSNSGLPASMTYYYRVRAYNSGGVSDYSSVASATTLPPPPVAVTFTSIAAQDGYVLESSETSLTGGSASATTGGTSGLRAGDDNRDRQVKAVVSFDTSSIPDGATIVSATLRLKRGAVSGTNPFQTHSTCLVDIKSGNGFHGSTTLTKEDFQAPADAAQVATLSDAAANGQWSEGNLIAAGLPFVNLTGTTQFRISFALDDNDDLGTDYIGWYSSESTTSGNRPQLVVVYQP